tara:strand:+ start:2454 stop:3080 length:627 start_codon:yes stop_codon:yes gene_type:complete
MKNTKDVILKTALYLFNTHGLAKITLRSIAKEMGISQGNLNYHFKKREDIIETLYFQLVKNIDDSISNTKKLESVLELVFNISKTIMYNFYEYRFFMLDFVQIMRENDTIKTHYLVLTTEREQEFAMLFELLVEEGTMRKEILPNEYNNLYKRFQILGDFWISSAETKKQPLTKESVPIYSELINQTIFPYLTTNGKKKYHSLIPSEL